jgi:flavin-dependent dehydrogenase
VTTTTSENAARTDVLVVGGGPAGSTIATLLRRQGHAVMLVERDRHPRFHIGESLLPMNLPIFERLGVLDRVAAIGVKKLGADFPTRRNARGYNTFAFARTLNPGYGYAYQVKREELDKMLFDHAAETGVDTHQETRVESVDFDADGVSAIARRADGSTLPIRARYLVDASGRDTFLGGRMGLKGKSGKHQSAALFAHFSGVQRRPGEDAGNISVIRFAHGWVWMIPLRDDVTSIGAVCWPEYLKTRRGKSEEFLIETLREIPDVWSRMADAKVVGNSHVTGNYSYTCTAMSGPRWLMVGDAYAFVDPIFSSGVYLAMNSATLAADVVDGALREPSRERALQRAYEARVRRGLRQFQWFIYRFTSPAMTQLFANPRNALRLEEATISMLAGDVFGGFAVRSRLLLFKFLYYTTALTLWPRQWSDYRRRRRQLGERFAGGTTGQDHA